MELTLQTRVRLNNGVEMPVLGLGVWSIPAGGPARRAVRVALECGYRLIDTAKIYGNEADVGAAVRESGVPRDDVFVTTKVWGSDQGYASTLRAFEESRQRLGLEVVDLYLIHWPVERLRAKTWDAMVELLKSGRCRAIGVSNYTVRHLRENLAKPTVVPAVDQVEFHPFLYEKALVHFCDANGIAVEAYSPLTRGRRLRDRTIGAVARKYRKSAAQILIRWSLQHGLIAIPKSAKPDHIRENSEVFDFELAEEDMAVLDALDESYHTDWDPTDAP